MKLKLYRDGDIHTRRKIELLKLVDRAGRGSYNIDKALMGAQLELLHALLVGIGRTIDRKTLYPRGKRYRTGNHSARALGGLYDFARALVYGAEIKPLEFNCYFLCRHNIDNLEN